MDEHLYENLEVEIRKVSLGVPGILDIKKCFIRKVGMKYYIDLSVVMNSNMTVRQGHDLAHKLKDTLLEKINNISDVLIHVEPN